MSVVGYERSGRIATITIDRPEAMNALNREVSTGLAESFARFRADEDAWVAVVYGAGGRAFSAGADLKEMSGRRQRDASQGPVRPPLAALTARPDTEPFVGQRMPKPMIAAIDGYCLAGGLELALACDIRVCSPQSKFGLTEVRRGIIPGAGGTQRLPRAVPVAIALELMMTARHMDAEDALRYGLVNRIVPSEQVLPTALEIAGQIAANAPLAVRAVKEAALRGLDRGLAEGLRLEAYLSQLVVQTEDAREGPQAFAEKREPRFEGR